MLAPVAFPLERRCGDPPLFWLGNACDMIGFHAASWLDVAGQWREGFFPRDGCGRTTIWRPVFIYLGFVGCCGAALGFCVRNALPGVFIVIAQTMREFARLAERRLSATDRGAFWSGVLCAIPKRC